MEDLNAASLADVQEWFKTYYGPSNATLVIAGDVDVKTAREKVQKYFGDIPPGPPVAYQNSWVAKMTGVHRQQAQDRVPAARVFNVWNVPQYGQADADYLDLVSDVLSEGKDSRLYKRLVYDEQIATSVNCGVNPSEIGLTRSEEHTSELQSRENLVCRLLLEKKKNQTRANASGLYDYS